MLIKFHYSFCFCLLLFFSLLFIKPIFAKETTSSIEVTESVMNYALTTVKPILDLSKDRDQLSLLLNVSEILLDPETGIASHKVEPNTFMTYSLLQNIGLGFFVTWGLSPEQRNVLTTWHKKYMSHHPANVFFAPTANDIIQNKAAFGCSHYARSYIAVVKALGLVNHSEDLRYVISSTAKTYNQALDKNDKNRTINGHQFVLVKTDDFWIAINTSKGNWIAMEDDFSPELVTPPHNIPIQFTAYPDVTFLLRKVGKNYNDDCHDSSLEALMNISRSGDDTDPDFKWDRFDL